MVKSQSFQCGFVRARALKQGTWIPCLMRTVIPTLGRSTGLFPVEGKIQRAVSNVSVFECRVWGFHLECLCTLLSLKDTLSSLQREYRASGRVSTRPSRVAPIRGAPPAAPGRQLYFTYLLRAQLLHHHRLSQVFGGEELQLDYCKLYPCLDLPYTLSRKWKEEGVWKPIAEHDFPAFLDLLRHAMAVVPPWVRVNRVQRDFPEAREANQHLGFVSDNIRSNLQQMVMEALKKNGQGCYDVRSREIKNQFPSDTDARARLFVRSYRANHGTELFISVELPTKGAIHQVLWSSSNKEPTCLI